MATFVIEFLLTRWEKLKPGISAFAVKTEYVSNFPPPQGSQQPTLAHMLTTLGYDNPSYPSPINRLMATLPATQAASIPPSILQHINYRILKFLGRQSLQPETTLGWLNQFPQMPDYGETRCPICFEDFTDQVATYECGHLFHLGCLVEVMMTPTGEEKSMCPMCKSVPDLQLVFDWDPQRQKIKPGRFIFWMPALDGWIVDEVELCYDTVRDENGYSGDYLKSARLCRMDLRSVQRLQKTASGEKH